MVRVAIDGVLVMPLKRIVHPKGDIFYGIKSSDSGFVGFGDAYFSTIVFDEVKAWKKHRKMTLNLIVSVGEIKVVLYDDRNGSPSKGLFFQIHLSPDNYQRLTVPPRLWFGFQGKGKSLNMLLNIADMEHDPDEVERLEPFDNRIPYLWKTQKGLEK